MISDNIILKVLGNRNNYFKYRHVVQVKALLERSVQIVNDLEAWYDLNPKLEEVNWQAFSEWFRFLRHPSLSEEESQLYAIIFDRVSKTENDTLADSILKNLVERAYARQLIQLGTDIVQGRSSVNDAQLIVDECNEQLGKVDNAESDPDLVKEGVVELLEEVYGEKSTGLHWPLKELNVSLGPLREGDSVMVAAYVDSGKTSFVLYSLQHMAKLIRPDQQVLYFANEERGKKIKLRFIQSMLGITKEKMKESFSETLHSFKKMWDINRFLLYYNTSMSARYVEERIRRHNPGIIVIDQLWNLSGFDKMSMSNVDRYTELAKWARRQAKHCPVIFTHQADSTSNGVKFIEMNALYGSKVGIQAATDAIIMLGRELGTKDKSERGIYTPKNKLDGDSNTKEEYSNAKWDVKFDSDRCLFKGSL